MGPISTSLRALAAVSVVLVSAVLGTRDAAAQFNRTPTTPLNRTPTTPPPPLDAGVANSYLSAPGAIFDMASKFLRDNANQAGVTGFGQGVLNPLGGGADAATAAPVRPRYRFWAEGYGLRSRTGAQNVFTGDTRKSFGGIAGLGLTLPSGWSAGVSVDQGHTKVDVRNLPQSSTIDLTQLGGNLAYETGPWSFTVAGIHGFGDVNARRTDAGGLNIANYDVKLWGAIGEISYYWSTESANTAWRVVPKIGIDWTRIEIDPFTESGGAIPVRATAQNTERVRGFAAVETGYSWLANKMLYDVGVYARVVDIFSQNIDAVLASATNGAALPLLIPGVIDDRFEFDAGASASVKLSDALRLYALYDGRFRDGFTAHAGTLGFEYRW